MPVSRTRLALLLLGMWAAAACSDASCGGCVTPLEQPFPRPPRVYDATQVRVQRTGFDFIERNLPDILDTLLADGLNFEVPPQTIDAVVTDVDICDTPCPLQVTIQDAHLSLLSPDKLRLDGHIAVDGTITMDTTIIVDVHCDFPLQIDQKPISAEVALRVDPASDFLYFQVSDLQISIAEEDYDIACPPVFDDIMEWLKPALTSVLDSQLQSQVGQAVDDLIAQQTCLPCDFYTGGCPAGSSCNGDGYCEQSGACLVRPQGLVGTLDLGSQLGSVDPGNQARADLLLALGQAQQPMAKPFVKGQGLELRLIGGTDTLGDDCATVDDPQQIPPNGEAPAMTFPAVVPSTGEGYMLGAVISDMYLDHFLFKLWRSGLLCLDLDSYHLSQLSSQTLALFIPSLTLLSDGANVPVRMRTRPLSIPYLEIGAGTFLPDGSIDQPLLSMFLPDFRMDFWMRLQGRWVLFLSLLQDIRIDLGLSFTPDNELLPLLDGDSVMVSNVTVSHHELLAEDEQELAQVIPQLVGMFLPLLTDQLGAISIGDLQGFVLDVKSVEGNVARAGSDFYEFLAIYADIAFAPSPPPVRTAARLLQDEDGSLVIDNPAPDQEVQLRRDGGAWTPFYRGSEIHPRLRSLPGRHLFEWRARRIGAPRTLDPRPLARYLDIGDSGRALVLPAPASAVAARGDDTGTKTRAMEALPGPEAATGCSTPGPGRPPSPWLLVLAALLAMCRGKEKS